MEGRKLLAFDLVQAIASADKPFFLAGTNYTTATLNEAPQQIALRFSAGVKVDPATVATSITITRSGGIGDAFANGNDIVVTPGYIGVDDLPNDNQVVIRFAETLPNDSYRITIGASLKTLAEGPTAPVQMFRDGVGFDLNFKLDLGAQVTSVVPQPVIRPKTITFSAVPQDGDLLELNIRGGRTVFEFDTGNGVQGNNTPISLAGTTLATLPALATAVSTAINALATVPGFTGELNSASASSAVVTVSGVNFTPVVKFTRGGVVPASVPVTIGDGPTLTQLSSKVVVYFNAADPLAAASVVAGAFKLFTIDPTTGVDSGSPLSPSAVSYDEASASAVLTFPTGVGNLDAGKLYRLQIGQSSVTARPDVTETDNANSTFAAAKDLGSLTAGPLDRVSIKVMGAINATSDVVTPAGSVAYPDQPGDGTEPGHRDIPSETHLGGAATPPGAITVGYFNFNDYYGTDVQTPGNVLHNAITETQKQRAREIFDLYSRYTGIRFIESETQPSAITVVTGDLRAVAPGFPREPLAGIANGKYAIIDSSDDWGESEFGGGWFRVAMHEIGHCLTLGHAYDIPSIMGDTARLGAEGVYPGNYDNVHMNYLYPRVGTDIDLYKFQLTAAGKLTAQTFVSRADSPVLSELDSVLTLYREDLVGGKSVRTFVARNDDSFGRDSFVGLDLAAGTYYIAVTSAGNTNFNPEITDSGYGGRTDGAYELRVDFSPAASVTSPVLDKTGTPLDGDRDGKSGGEYKFWFETAASTNDPATNKTLFVDKAAYASFAAATTAGANGTLAKPFYRIQDAIAAAAAGSIIRIVGNTGNAASAGDDKAYLVGTDPYGRVLEDGESFVVPKNVTVMIDAGATLKLRAANIDVGSSSSLVDRSGAVLQVLGTPNEKVYFTSYHDDARGGDSDKFGPAVQGGQWGGLVFRGDSDFAKDRVLGTLGTSQNNDSVFLNSVSNASLRYGGGAVLVDGFEQNYAPLHLESTRPSLVFNSVTDSAGAPISADPNSFEDTAGRVGPEIRGNRLVDNSVNGIFVRIRTELGRSLDKLSVPARFMNTDAPYVLTENLLVDGGAGGYVEDSTTGDVYTRASGRLQVGPGVVIKLWRSRIELERGMAQFIAEGLPNNRVVFTTLADNRFGGGGTFDTNGIDLDVRTPGDWGGIIVNAGAKASIDRAYIAYGGGETPIEGRFDNFSVVETHQGDLRLANSRIENNAASVATSDRDGRGANDSSTVFVRGAQPVIVNNDFRSNAGAMVSINANALVEADNPDWGRSTGAADRFTAYDDNRGPLVRGNSVIAQMRVIAGTTTILPSATVGSTITTLTAVGLPGAGLSFALADGAGATDNSLFSIVGNRLLLAAATPKNTLEVRVRAASADGQQVETPLTLSVQGTFTYAFSNVAAQNADAYLASSTGVRKYQETFSVGNNYWGPTANGTTGELVYKFDFPVGTPSRISLKASTPTWDFNNEPGGFGRGASAVEVSKDGTTWATLHDNLNPLRFTVSSQAWGIDGDLPSQVVGGTSVWLRVKLYAEGAPGGYTVAQFARSTPNATAPVFQLQAFWPTSSSAASAPDLLGMKVRGEEITVESVWDDTDVVHVLQNEIIVQNFHTATGLRLQSSPNASLVVKLLGANAGLTAAGYGLDINDRIGGTVQVVGFPTKPVILTSLNDDTVGASYDPLGRIVTDTNGNGSATTAAAGDWRSLKFLPLSNDRNVAIVQEAEAAFIASATTDNAKTTSAQVLGVLAPNFATGTNTWESAQEKSGDENRRLGFQVQGTIALDNPGDNDVYAFQGYSGSEVWFDLDKTASSLDAMVELLDANGNVLARSADAQTDGSLTPSVIGLAQPLTKDAWRGGDSYTTNPRDPGMRVILPTRAGYPIGTLTQYYVRVRSQAAYSAATSKADYEAGLTGTSAAALAAGASAGDYQLTIRLRQIDEKPGSTVRSADIRFPTTGIDALGLPHNSQVLGETAEGLVAGFSLDSFASPSQLQLNGDAKTQSGSLVLTNGQPVVTSSVWNTVRQSVAQGFETTVRFTITDILSTGADGFAFVIQDQSTTAIGGQGGGIGYAGLNRFLAIEFDTWFNDANESGDNNGNHIDIRLRGAGAFASSSDFGASLGRNTPRSDMSDGKEHTAVIRYDGSTLNVYLDDLTTPIVSAAVNLGSALGLTDARAFVGLTAASGSAAAQKLTVSQWKFAAQVPLSIENDVVANAQKVGNLLAVDRNTISIGGELAATGDIDWYTFNVDVTQTQSVGGVNGGQKTWSAVFDLDYADGIRGDLTLSVFDKDGRLIFVGRDSDVKADQPGAGQGNDFDDQSRGSVGKLDPYIGPVQLPTNGGPYYVAVSSNERLPKALQATFVGKAANPGDPAINTQFRLEPVNVLSRVIEDHMGAIGYKDSAKKPILPTNTAPLIGTDIREVALAAQETGRGTITTFQLAHPNVADNSVNGLIKRSYTSPYTGQPVVEQWTFTTDVQTGIVTIEPDTFSIAYPHAVTFNNATGEVRVSWRSFEPDFLIDVTGVTLESVNYLAAGVNPLSSYVTPFTLADVTLFLSTTGGLYTHDAVSGGRETTISATAYAGLTIGDIDIRPDGKLYAYAGVTGDATTAGQLMELDSGTGASITVSKDSIPNVAGANAPNFQTTTDAVTAMTFGRTAPSTYKDLWLVVASGGQSKLYLAANGGSATTAASATANQGKDSPLGYQGRIGIDINNDGDYLDAGERPQVTGLQYVDDVSGTLYGVTADGKLLEINPGTKSGDEKVDFDAPAKVVADYASDLAKVGATGFTALATAPQNLYGGILKGKFFALTDTGRLVLINPTASTNKAAALNGTAGLLQRTGDTGGSIYLTGSTSGVVSTTGTTTGGITLSGTSSGTTFTATNGLPASIRPDMLVVGTGIPYNTTVVSTTGPSVTLSRSVTAATTGEFLFVQPLSPARAVSAIVNPTGDSSATVNLDNASDVQAGMLVICEKLPNPTVVTAVNGSDITFSNAYSFSAPGSTRILFVRPDATLLGTLYATSKTVTGITTTNLRTGMAVFGVGIPDGARIESLTPTSIDLTLPATGFGQQTLYFVDGRSVINIPDTSRLKPGMVVGTSPSIGANTTVVSVGPSSVVLSQGAIGTTALADLRFFQPVVANAPGTVALGSASVTNIPTTGLEVGMIVVGQNIPANTTIRSIDSPTSITLSYLFPSAGPVSLTFYRNNDGTPVVLAAPTNLATAGITTGMLVFGQGIAGNTTVASLDVATKTLTLSKPALETISTNELRLVAPATSRAAAIAQGTNTLTVSTTVGISVDMVAVADGIPDGALVTAVDAAAKTVTLEQQATKSSANVTVRFITADIVRNGTADPFDSTGKTLTLSTANLHVGMLVFGNGVPTGTVITARAGNTVTLSNAIAPGPYRYAFIRDGRVVSNISGMNNLLVGQTVTGTSIPAGVTVAAINAADRQITLSQSVTAARSSNSLTFTGPGVTNAIVGNLPSTANLSVGMSVIGTGVPAGTTIVTIDDYKSITLSAAIATSGARDLIFVTAGQLASPAVTRNATTTLGSTVASLSSVADLRVGMLVQGANLPANVLIVSRNLTLNTITLSAAATATGLDSLKFINTSTLDYLADWSGDFNASPVLAGAAGGTGIAFSPLDINLWHPTTSRGGDSGHGINAAPDFSRGATGGGTSMYFGLDPWAEKNPVYRVYPGESGQFGVTADTWQQDLTTNTGRASTYNLPGGAYGSVTTNSFSLVGSTYTQKPTFYFNYLLDTEDASGLGAAMRDSARAFISKDGGLTWELIATNNQTRSNTSELPNFPSASSAISYDSRQQVQELFDTGKTTGWRQARIDLGNYAGQPDLRLRFDFSTAGEFDPTRPDPKGTILGPASTDGDFSSAERGQKNAFEGFYIDDFIVGFAGRGEMVTYSGTTASITDPTGFFDIGSPNPGGSFPAQYLMGPYQLEMRRGTEYGSVISAVKPDIRIDQIYGINEEFIRSLGLLGDENQPREQGQFIVEGNWITYAKDYGISIDAGDRDPVTGAPASGAPRKLPTLNNSRLAPGAVVVNNIVSSSGTAGIRFSGDPNTGIGPLAAVPYGRIVNNTIYGAATPAGVGVQVTENAAPTLINNLFSGLTTAIDVDATSVNDGLGNLRTVIGTSAFHNVGTQVKGATASQSLTLASNPFVAAQFANYYLTEGTPAIDSALNTLQDRTEYNVVTSPLGIPVSPILAPERDIYGQFRGDDPKQANATGLGSSIVKDRGAVDRVDFAAPYRTLVIPADSVRSAPLVRDDLEHALTASGPAGRGVTKLLLQLTDKGSGIDAGSVVDPTTLAVRPEAFALLRGAQTLLAGTDYLVSYDPLRQIVTFEAVTVFAPDSYTVRAISQKASGTQAGLLIDRANNTLRPNNDDGTLDFQISFQDVPDAPGNFDAVCGNGSVTLSWTPPATNGSPIVDYAIDYSADGGVNWIPFIDAVSVSTTTTVTGLTNGTTYQFRVAAYNQALPAVAGAYATLTAVPLAAPALAIGPGVTSPVSLVEATQPAGVVTVTGRATFTISVTFTRGTATVTKQVTGTGVDQAIVLTPTEAASLGSGTVSVSATLADGFGHQTTPTTLSFAFDAVAPSPPGLALGPGVTDPVSRSEATQPAGVVLVTGELGAAITVTFTRGANTVTKLLTGTGAAQPVVLSVPDLGTLGNGLITVSSTQVDAAGNPQAVPSPAMFFTLDSVAPNAPTLALGNGVAGGATAAEATQPTGVVTVSGELAATITVTFTRGTAVVTKTLTGTGASQAVVLLPADLITLGDGVVSVAATQVDQAGNPQTAPAATTSFTLDTALPFVAGFGTTTPGGAYKAGSAIAIFATMSEAVRSGSTFNVTLNTGVTVTLTAPGNGTRLFGTYTVAAGENTPRLNVASITTGSVFDLAGNAMTSTAFPQFGFPAGIVIDTIAPNAPTLALGNGVTGGATAAEATQVSGVVTVSGERTATITVTFTRGTAVVTKTLTGTGASQAVVLLPADLTTLGNGIIAVAATQVDKAGNPQTGPAATTSFTLDSVAPNVPTLALGAGVAGGATSAEATQSSGVVTVSGELAATITVTFTRGTAVVTKSLTGTGASQPVVLTLADLTMLGDGTIAVAARQVDRAGNSQTAPAATATFTLETILPFVVGFGTTTPGGAYKAGSSIAIYATISEAVRSGSAFNVILNTGVTVTLTAPGNGTRLYGTYTVAVGQNTPRLNVASITTGSVSDLAGNAMASTAFPQFGFPAGIVVDTTAPTVASFSSTAAAGFYKAGSTITIRATMAEAVRAGATFTATLNSGATVTLTAASQGTLLSGLYTVAVGQNAANLAVTSFTVGTVLDVAGNAMTATSLPGTNLPAGILVDTIAPNAPILTLGSGVAGGATAAEATQASGVATVSGEPAATITVTFTRAAAVVTKTLTGTGAAQAVVLTGAELLTLGDGTVTVAATQIDKAGNPQTAAATTTTFNLDTVAATVTITTSKPTMQLGETATITFTLSEASTNFTAADVAVTGGTLTGFSGSGSSYSATFTPVLNSAAAGTFTVAAGTFTDAAGNPNTAGSLAVPITIDRTIRATATGFSATAPGPGLALAVTTVPITFNTPVTGLSLAALKLYYEGRSVSLTGATLTGGGSSYTLTLPANTASLKGRYQLDIGGPGSGVASGSVAMDTISSIFWQRI